MLKLKVKFEILDVQLREALASSIRISKMPPLQSKDAQDRANAASAPRREGSDAISASLGPFASVAWALLKRELVAFESRPGG